MNNKTKNILSRIGISILDYTYMVCIMICILLCIKVLTFSPFKIPSNSMGETLIEGDNILVNKANIGARIFNIFTSVKGEETSIYRLPGMNKIQRDDVLVFNFPYSKNWDYIYFDFMKYYIKRCIGLPKDSIYIKQGFYGITGIHISLGNLQGQQIIQQQTQEFLESRKLFYTYPEDSTLKWNVHNFGPLYIPAKGDIITMNRKNAVLYRKLIEWEQKKALQIVNNDSIYLDKSKIETYQFMNNYYFVAGDRVEDSQDSRYWGLLPEEFIVGKAWIIWKSVDKNTNKIRWNRFLKKIS